MAVVEWISNYSYPFVYLLLLACGVGAPLSEELVVLTGGVVAAKGGASLGLIIAVAWAGVLSGDFLLFSIGRKLGPAALEKKWIKRMLKPERVEVVRGHFNKRAIGTLVLARFLPGFRAPTFLIAGICGVRPRTFLLTDGLGALVTAPLVAWLGYRFGPAVIDNINVIGRYVLAAVVVSVLVVLLRGQVQKRRRALA